MRSRPRECNCSICRMTGYLHLIVDEERFRLDQGRRRLATYSFNTGTAKHLFCSVCGVKSFYVPRSNPDGFSVNVRCLDDGQVRVDPHRRFRRPELGSRPSPPHVSKV